MVNIFCFDHDHTLNVPGGPYPPGPVELEDLRLLRMAGHIVAIAGNWPVFVSLVPNWQQYVSCIGPMANASSYLIAKVTYLKQMKAFMKADAYIMIGNDPRQHRVPVSDDRFAAAQAGYRFISEKDWANGTR